MFALSHFAIFGPVWLSLGTALCSCPGAVPFGHPLQGLVYEISGTFGGRQGIYMSARHGHIEQSQSHCHQYLSVFPFSPFSACSWVFVSGVLFLSHDSKCLLVSCIPSPLGIPSLLHKISFMEQPLPRSFTARGQRHYGFLFSPENGRGACTGEPFFSRDGVTLALTAIFSFEFQHFLPLSEGKQWKLNEVWVGTEAAQH